MRKTLFLGYIATMENFPVVGGNRQTSVCKQEDKTTQMRTHTLTAFPVWILGVLLS